MRRRLIYQVAIGPERPLWERCLMSMETYCRRHGIEHYVQRQPILRIRPAQSHRSEAALKLGYLPIFEKWNAYPLLAQYDEIGILDADVWAQPFAPSVFDAVPDGYDFAAHVEYDGPISLAYQAKLRSYARGQYGEPQKRFRNMGVEIVRQPFLRFFGGEPVGQFIHRPQFAKFVNGEGAYRWQTEQSMMNVWLEQCGARVFDLPWIWNCLFGATTTTEGAHLVHFFLSGHLTSHDPEAMLRTGRGRPKV